MSAAYWVGLLTLPALIVAFAGALLALRGVLHLVGRLQLIIAPRRGTNRNLNLIAGVVNSAHRAWKWGNGNHVLIFVSGYNAADANEAYRVLNESGPHRDVRVSDLPFMKGDKS